MIDEDDGHPDFPYEPTKRNKHKYYKHSVKLYIHHPRGGSVLIDDVLYDIVAWIKGNINGKWSWDKLDCLLTDQKLYFIFSFSDLQDATLFRLRF